MTVPIAGESGGTPMVSVIVPCRNEQAYIASCIDSILASTYPAECMEVIVVDGASDDGTRDVLSSYASRGRLRVIDNPARITPVALNLGIAAARGGVIVRMDAHNEYPVDYVTRLVGWLERSGADNVGGVCRTRPGAETPMAHGIAAALAHPFGVGNSYFRIGVGEPRWVDTVPFGCYRREVFDRIGGFDETLARNQDDEFNLRLRRANGRILLVPEVECVYYARATLRQLARMYYQYGFFKPYVARKVGALSVRQLVPPLFVIALAAGTVGAVLWPPARLLLGAVVGVYTLAVVGVSLSVVRRLGASAASRLVVIFPVLHLSYGVGYLRGALDLMLGRWRRGRSLATPLSR